jgi:hypothetical protein
LLLSEMEMFFEVNGIYNHTSQEVRNYLLEKLPEEIVPSVTTIRKMMKDKFHLRYKKLDKANTKYRERTYNEKRIWISRLMA